MLQPLTLSRVLIIVLMFIVLVSRETFNKWQAQKWWTDNYEKVMELYNVQRLNRQAFPLHTAPRSEDEVSLVIINTTVGIEVLASLILFLPSLVLQ